MLRSVGRGASIASSSFRRRIRRPAAASSSCCSRAARCGALDLPKIAAKTSGFTGADLGNLVESAADLAIEKSLESGAEQVIEQRALAEALESVKPTSLEWLTTARNHARYANESGQYDEVLAFLRENGAN